MAHRVELIASIVVQNLALPEADQLAAQAEKVDLQVDHEEFGEIELVIPQTPGGSPYVAAKVFDLAGAGVTPRSLLIKTDSPIGLFDDGTLFLQPIRSLFVATYSPGDEPALLKFVNLNATDARVKIIFGSKNPS
jgi:hypothetical protein